MLWDAINNFGSFISFGLKYEFFIKAGWRKQFRELVKIFFHMKSETKL